MGRSEAGKSFRRLAGRRGETPRSERSKRPLRNVSLRGLLYLLECCYSKVIVNSFDSSIPPAAAYP